MYADGGFSMLLLQMRAEACSILIEHVVLRADVPVLTVSWILF